MSTPYPAKNGGSGGENEFNDVQGCDQSVLADTEYERLQRKYGRVAQESFEFNEERYVPESIDEDDDELEDPEPLSLELPIAAFGLAMA